MSDLVIIGGGAAGLMAASAVSETKDINVTVIEKNERMARKLMITGKGRCNVTNNCDTDTLIKNTVRNGKFMYSAFNKFSSANTIAFFEILGVPLKTERGNRVFPVSDRSVSIVDALTSAAGKKAIFLHDTVKEINTADGKVTAVVCESGKTLKADAVIVATGGISYPVTGSTGDGYRLAKATGHSVTELCPSLIDIKCNNGFCSELAGLSLKNVTLSVVEEGKKKPVYKELGELLFTHTGISGPLSLSASAHIKPGKKYQAVIDLKPALDTDTLDRRILRDFSKNINCDFINSLSELVPKSLVPVIVRLSGIEPRKKVNQISSAERHSIVKTLKELTLQVKCLGNIEEAIITRGGVSVKEIDPGTMASKLVRGLYFAGEVIDVDALTGGFNLQIAFSTGYLAATSAVKEIKGDMI